MTCPVKFCENSKNKITEKKLSWHASPPRTDPRRQLWLDICEKSDYGKFSRICSDHFNESDYFTKDYWTGLDGYKSRQRKLKPNAVPFGK